MRALKTFAAPSILASTADRAFLLAAACCRPAGIARDLAVRSAAEGVDWRGFVQMVARHRVEGLAQEALNRAGVSAAADVADELRRAALDIAASGLRLAAESHRLQRALDDAGLVNLVLKGATLDRLAWGRLGLKRAWDIDLLVLREDAPAARVVLESKGYSLMDPPEATAEAFAMWVSLSKESVFRRASDGVIVELHWRLTDTALLLPNLSAASPAQVVALSDDITLRTLAPDALFAYLCVHGATHAWSRLKWLADLGGLLAALNDEARVDLYRRGRKLGAGRCPDAALLLCEGVLGLPMPPDLATAVRKDAGAVRLARLAMDAMAGGGATEIDERRFFNDRIVLSQLLFADGWRFRFAEAARQAVSIDDRMTLRLPRAMSFLYPVVRLPLWIRRRLGRRDGFRPS
jgi:hypothetical protein